jgi:hypothetical protein
MWLAHYAFHFLTGALTIIPVMQAYLNDSGFNVGQPSWQFGPAVPLDWLFPIQTVFLYLGLFGTLVAAFQIAVGHPPCGLCSSPWRCVGRFLWGYNNYL